MEESRYERGMRFQNLRRMPDDQLARTESPEELEPLDRMITEFVHGDVYSRDILTLREREMVTIAALVAMNLPQVEGHCRTGLALGMSKEEIEEIILQTIPFAGFPTAINGLKLLKKVVAEETAKGNYPLK